MNNKYDKMIMDENELKKYKFLSSGIYKKGLQYYYSPSRLYHIIF